MPSLRRGGRGFSRCAGEPAAKAATHFAPFTARLKPCPDTNRSTAEYNFEHCGIQLRALRNTTSSTAEYNLEHCGIQLGALRNTTWSTAEYNLELLRSFLRHGGLIRVGIARQLFLLGL